MSSENILILVATPQEADILASSIEANNVLILMPLGRLMGVNDTRFSKAIISRRALNTMDKLKWYTEAVMPLLTPDCELVDV